MSKEERERKTRKARIDPRLTKAGWSLAPFAGASLDDYKRHAAVEEFETSNGPSDYALVSKGHALGVVEAKKVGSGPQEVLTQAERYSRGFPIDDIEYEGGYRVPFLYSTNGEVIWFRDVRHPRNRQRQLAGFHTPDALAEFLGREVDADLEKLDSIPYHALLREYQIEAHQAVEDQLRKRRRNMLLAMATGTGKTLTMVSQVYRLMKSGAARRVLFLVDRRALAAQAVRAFASFEAEPGLKFDSIYEVYSQRFQKEDFEEGEKFDPKLLPKSYLTKPHSGQAFVYVCTIQRMSINLFGRENAIKGDIPETDDEAERLDIPIHAFDIVIADECHRGYTSKELSAWRNTLDHFDAARIGLTATPAAHTLAYFEHIAYRYEYERAVREGHLVDYEPIRISSNVRINGVFLDEGEQVGTVDTETGQQQFDTLEDERHFDTSEIEKLITAPDSNRKILEEIKRYADEHREEFGRLPKILIFADNDIPHTSHADQLVKIARDVFDEGDDFVRKITGKVDRPLQRIREFRNRPKPGIAVTVDLLSTGVDIPDLEFIVFLRAVKSRILFTQMLGRGTRKGEKFPDKSHFKVFDCFDGTLLEYFKSASDITAELPEPETTPISKVIENIWNNVERDYNLRRLIKRLRRIDKQMAAEAREKFAMFSIPNGDLGGFAQELPALLERDFTGTMGILRNAGLQELLVNYPRPPRIFYVSYGTEDIVTSEALIRGGGKEYKPDDYLKVFADFVRTNSDTIDAIGVVLSKPEGWTTSSLDELRLALRQAPEGFSEANLQRAFQVVHRKPLVDIISMVKRAAERESPLLTTEERAHAALERVVGKRELTADQVKWLDHIRQHLIANLSIDRDDFDNVPVLLNRGGWARANKVFDGALDALLVDVNRELVAA